MGPISSKVKQSRPDKSKLGDIDKKSNGTIRKVDEEVQENRGRYLSMALEEKRNLYKTKTYVVLSEIKTWQQQAQAVMRKFAHENVKPVRKVDERLNNKISLWQGDITTLEIDAIVNAAKNSLMGGGGVDGAIHAAAGSKLRKECATISPCETGDAKITAGYKLPARYIIHTVGPIGINPVKLSSCYKKSMEIMKHEKLRTVAFSCISTGVYGYDIEKATPVVMKTVRRWLTDNHENIERILFCVYRPKDLEVYERNLLMYFPVDSDGNRLGSTNNQKETTESKADKVEKVKSETERVIISKNGVSDKKTKEDGLGPVKKKRWNCSFFEIGV